MNEHAVVGVFDSRTEAERAQERLTAAGFDRNEVRLTARDATTTATTGSTAYPASDDRRDSGGGFWDWLFGSDEGRDDATYYSEAVHRGNTVVTVDARDDVEAERAADILNECGALNIHQRAEEWRQSGWAGSAPAGTAGGEQAIPVVKEDVQIGKRRVERGGVRIYKRTTETPVEEDVRLREEHATVKRRAVDRPATEADYAALDGGTLEVRESVEEPVIAKNARVVEEVVVNKEASERTETVRDTARKTEVDVEQVDPTETSAGKVTGTKKKRR